MANAGVPAFEVGQVGFNVDRRTLSQPV